MRTVNPSETETYILRQFGLPPHRIVHSDDSVTLYFLGGDIDQKGAHSRVGRVVSYADEVILTFEDRSMGLTEIWSVKSMADIDVLMSKVLA